MRSVPFEECLAVASTEWSMVPLVQARLFFTFSLVSHFSLISKAFQEVLVYRKMQLVLVKTEKTSQCISAVKIVKFICKRSFVMYIMLHKFTSNNWQQLINSLYCCSCLNKKENRWTQFTAMWVMCLFYLLVLYRKDLFETSTV